MAWIYIVKCNGQNSYFIIWPSIQQSWLIFCLHNSVFQNNIFFWFFLTGQATPESYFGSFSSPVLPMLLISSDLKILKQHLYADNSKIYISYCDFSPQTIHSIQLPTQYLCFEKAGLKLNLKKTKIMASSPITSWQIDGETVETMKILCSWTPKSLQTLTAATKLNDTSFLEEKPWPT